MHARRITLSVSARRAIEVAGLEAQRLGAEYIGTEHLLLGILAERGSPAALHLASGRPRAGSPRRRPAGQLLPDRL